MTVFYKLGFPVDKCAQTQFEVHAAENTILGSITDWLGCLSMFC
jgi:hypothetical protein